MVTEQLVINRARRELLAALAAGRIYRSAGGCDLWFVRNGQNKRIERRLRELLAAGLAGEPTDGRYYVITDAGRARLAESA